MIPYLSTLFFEAIRTDAAPSFNELAFAAVIEPFFLNTYYYFLNTPRLIGYIRPEPIPYPLD